MNHNQRTGWDGCRLACTAAIAFCMFTSAGCKDRNQEKPPATSPTKDVKEKPTPESASAPAQPDVTTKPATSQPAASQPAASQPSIPVSTYDSKPPYPVQLYVRSPDDKQPGWLKIAQLDDSDKLATTHAQFPKQNRIYIDTTNVKQLRVHTGHLPLAPGKRVILQIDGQGMELSRKRAHTMLQRRPTGEWVILKMPPK